MEISKSDVKDVAFATAKGVVSSVPFVGGVLSEYMGLAQQKIVNKRVTEWQCMIEEKLNILDRRFDELTGNEFFYSCVQITTVGAMKAYEQEKRQLFANALFNSAVLDLDQDKKLYFLSLLDRYTLTGIRLLKYYSENHYHDEDYVKDMGLMRVVTFPGTEHPIKSILENNPYFNNDSEYVISLSEQLAGDSLISRINFEMPESPQQTKRKRTTKLGDDFLRFLWSDTIKMQRVNTPNVIKSKRNRMMCYAEIR